MILDIFFISLSLVQSILLIVILGVLVSQFFRKRVGSNFNVIIFLVIIFSFGTFIGLGICGVFFNGLSQIYNMISFFALLFSIIGFGVLSFIIFKHLNFYLFLSESFLFSLIFLLLLFDWYEYNLIFVRMIMISTFMLIILSYFTLIDFYIKFSEGFEKRNKMEEKRNG